MCVEALLHPKRRVLLLAHPRPDTLTISDAPHHPFNAKQLTGPDAGEWVAQAIYIDYIVYIAENRMLDCYVCVHEGACLRVVSKFSLFGIVLGLFFFRGMFSSDENVVNLTLQVGEWQKKKAPEESSYSEQDIHECQESLGLLVGVLRYYNNKNSTHARVFFCVSVIRFIIPWCGLCRAHLLVSSFVAPWLSRTCMDGCNHPCYGVGVDVVISFSIAPLPTRVQHTWK